ncbi:MAG: 1-acyl-sn-glycerol-3-phosphate acyltransferase [Saprospiraceae bacterium]|nr:1-acyl-sn-glycerol-3-phosphate acyltransferase [Saprospiraceae bacterium]
MVKLILNIVALIRGLIVFGSMLGYMLMYGITRIVKKHNAEAAFGLRRIWINTIGLPVLNIHVEKKGEVYDKPAIYIGNHRSFADPVVVCRYVDAFVIAKAEVASYPIINKGAELTGVIWVNRNDKNSRKETRSKLLEIWSQGYNVLVFPEGTVGTDPTTLPFKMGTFIEAAQNNIPIVPFAIEFKSKKDLWVIKQFIPQYVYQFSKWKTSAKFYIGEPILDNDPESLKSKTQSWIDTNLKEMQKDWSEVF